MKLGTSSLIVAAFVGPGTVLTCASAGVSFGYSLGWVLLFSTVSVFVLQSFTAGTGILAGKGLGEALREAATGRAQRIVVIGFVITGLWLGCAAFEMGNLLGAASGFQVVMTGGDVRVYVAVMAAAAGLILLLDLRTVTRAFVGLVVLMSVFFVATMWVAPVDWTAALAGLVVPRLPDASLLTTLALVGTTIVTYNLFLHPSAARRYWHDVDPRRAWRGEIKGMALFIPIGGLISFAILAAGASVAGTEDLDGVASFATLLEPTAGAAARYLFGLGLLAAGITSAVTAPMAAAAGVVEVFGWTGETRRRRYRMVWTSVLLTGLFFGLTGFDPLAAIVAAQAANGILLPFIAVFVLYLTFRQEAVTLPRWYFGLGVVVTILCAGLGARTLWWVWTQLGG